VDRGGLVTQGVDRHGRRRYRAGRRGRICGTAPVLKGTEAADSSGGQVTSEPGSAKSSGSGTIVNVLSDSGVHYGVDSPSHTERADTTEQKTIACVVMKRRGRIRWPWPSPANATFESTMRQVLELDW
jgi:hypothetical protein